MYLHRLYFPLGIKYDCILDEQETETADQQT
jgi:hypothetical protein